jgi:hypothetical protein
VLKREIFVTELFTLSDLFWVGDLGTEANNLFLNIFMLIFVVLFLAMTKSSAKIEKLFGEYSAISKNCLANTQPLAKIV